QTGEGLVQGQLTGRDRTGKPGGTVGEAGGYGQMALSPDGGSIAFSALPRMNIWMYDSRGIKTRVTFTTSRDTSPVWSPDGTRIAFSSHRGRRIELYTQDASTVAE